MCIGLYTSVSSVCCDTVNTSVLAYKLSNPRHTYICHLYVWLTHTNTHESIHLKGLAFTLTLLRQ